MVKGKTSLVQKGRQKIPAVVKAGLAVSASLAKKKVLLRPAARTARNLVTRLQPVRKREESRVIRPLLQSPHHQARKSPLPLPPRKTS